MKGLKKIIMVLMVLSMVVVFALPASAAGWYVTNVEFAMIVDDGTVQIRLQNPDTGFSKTFVAPSGYENQYLAMALTAQSTGMQLKVLLDWTTAQSPIERMILLSPTQ